MDAKLQKTLENLELNNKIKDSDRDKAVSERFEEIIDETLTNVGVKFKREPLVNGKTPDGEICLENGDKIYVEAVCAIDVPFRSQGELDLCLQATPKLMELGVCVGFMDGVERQNEFGRPYYDKPSPLMNSIRKTAVHSFIGQIQNIVEREHDPYHAWFGTVKIETYYNKKKIEKAFEVFVDIPESFTRIHIEHQVCAVGYSSSSITSWSIGERYKANRQRINRKIGKYSSDDLNGCPIIIALSDNFDIWNYQDVAEIVYGTVKQGVKINKKLEKGSDMLKYKMMEFGNQEDLNTNV